MKRGRRNAEEFEQGRFRGGKGATRENESFSENHVVVSFFLTLLRDTVGVPIMASGYRGSE